MKIREKIKYFIALSGKNQVQIANELNCSRYTVQARIVQGTNIVKMLEILNVCDCDIYIKHRKTGAEMVVTTDDFKEEQEEKN